MAEELIVDERTYPLGSAAAAEVELAVKTGSLDVRGGAGNFCEARFEYSHAELRPTDDYDGGGDLAELSIVQPEVNLRGQVRNSWFLAFNSEVPVELAIGSASGNVSLDLDAVRLAGLNHKSRSGSTKASLGGSYPELKEMTFDSSSGKVALDLTGDFPTLEQVEIENRSGRTAIVVSGDCPNLRRLAIDCRSGNVDIDLTGSFEREDFGVRVDCRSGNVRVRVPASIGASLNASVKSGNTRIRGFESGSGRQTNAAFGETPATIWLNLHAMSGNISVVSE